MSLRPRISLTTLPSTTIATSRLRTLTTQLSLRHRPSALLPQNSSNARKMSSLPSTMKAVSFSKTGGPDVLEYSDSQSTSSTLRRSSPCKEQFRRCQLHRHVLPHRPLSRTVPYDPGTRSLWHDCKSSRRQPVGLQGGGSCGLD